MPNVPVSITISDKQAKASLADLKSDFALLKRTIEQPLVVPITSSGMGKTAQDYFKLKQAIEQPLAIKIDASTLNRQFLQIAARFKRLNSIATIKASVVMDNSLKVFGTEEIAPIKISVDSEYFRAQMFGHGESGLNGIYSTWLAQLDDVRIFIKDELFRAQLTLLEKDYNNFVTTLESNPLKVDLSINELEFRKLYKRVLNNLSKDITKFKNSKRIELKVFINKTKINTEFRKITSTIKSANKNVFVNIDTNAESAGAEITKLQNKLNSLTGRVYRIKISSEDATNNIRNMREQVGGLRRSAKTATPAIAAMFVAASTGATHTDRAVGQIGKTVTKSQGSLRTFGDDIQRILAVGFGAHLAKQAIEAANEFISMGNALTAILETTENAARANKFLRATAQDLGVDYKILTVEYTKFIAAAKESNVTSKEFHTAFSRISETVSVLNLRADTTHGIFKALTQMMSKGKVQAEELRGQLGEHLFGAFELVAKGMNQTTQSLDEMLKKGQISSRDLIIALPKALEEAYGAALPRAIVTGRAEFTRFMNDMSLMLDDNKEKIDELLFSLSNEFRVVLEIFNTGESKWLDKVSFALVKIVQLVELFALGTKILKAEFIAVGTIIGTVVAKPIQDVIILYEALKKIVSQGVGFFKGEGRIDQKGILSEMHAALNRNKKQYEEGTQGAANQFLKESVDATKAFLQMQTASANVKEFRKELLALKDEFKGKDLDKKSLELYHEFEKAGKIVPAYADVFKNAMNEVGGVIDKQVTSRIKKANKMLTDLLVANNKLRSEIEFGTGSPEADIHAVRTKLASVRFGKPETEKESKVRGQIEENIQLKQFLEFEKRAEAAKQASIDADEKLVIAAMNANEVIGMTSLELVRYNAVASISTIRTDEYAESYGDLMVEIETNKSFSNITLELRDQINELSMSAQAFDEYKLKILGLSDSQIKYIGSLNRTKQALESWESLSRDTADAVQQSFEEFLFDPFEVGLDGMLEGFITLLRRMAAERAASEISDLVFSGLKTLGTAAIGSFFGGGTVNGLGDQSLQSIDVSSSYDGMSINALESLLTNSKGNVFQSGNVVPFAKGGIPDVGNQIQYFPLANGGVGSLREQGSEAIMPLSRGSDGQLGVSVNNQSNSGSSGIVIQNLSVTVEEKEDETSEEQAASIGKAIRGQLAALIDDKIAKSTRSGAILNPTSLTTSF